MKYICYNEEQAKVTLFGTFVRLAKDVLKGFHSDLYHDAIILSNVTPEVKKLYWIVRENGTHLYDNEIDFNSAKRYLMENDMTARFYVFTRTDDRISFTWEYKEIDH